MVWTWLLLKGGGGGGGGGETTAEKKLLPSCDPLDQMCGRRLLL